MAPLVSVIIATYNRSGVLRHAIGSALASTVQDLELIVVGDHCTDDTETVVNGFDDARVRFVNLPANCGDQSGPSNHALTMAQGRYVAFLNQDDLYFPDHLERAIARLQATGAEMVLTPTLVIEPMDQAMLTRGDWRVTIGGTPRRDAYDPLVFFVASSWLVERHLFDRIGPWRHGSTLYVSPSEDWLYRAWRGGARIDFLERPGVIAVYSGARASSYASTQSPEHEACALRLHDPAFREQLLIAAAVAQARRWNDTALGSTTRRLARALAAPMRALCEWRGLHPLSAHLMMRFYRRGTLIARHRRHTGA